MMDRCTKEEEEAEVDDKGEDEGVWPPLLD